jgi:hypothetical protein
MFEQRSAVPLLVKGFSIPPSSRGPRSPLIEHIDIVINSDQQQILIEATSLPRCLTHPLWMGLGFLRCLQVEMRGAIPLFSCAGVL